MYVYNKTLVQFRDDVTVTAEFIRVVCYDVSDDIMMQDFYPFIQIKPSVRIAWCRLVMLTLNPLTLKALTIVV